MFGRVEKWIKICIIVLHCKHEFDSLVGIPKRWNGFCILSYPTLATDCFSNIPTVGLVYMLLDFVLNYKR